MTEQVQKDLDTKFMRECIALADLAARTGDLPFGSVVVHDGKIIGRGHNELEQNMQIDAHAERLAMLEAQRYLGSRKLSGCTLYSTVEPCPMCSFPLRELNVERVVFGLRSPVMGGLTRFDVLDDTGLSRFLPEFFGSPPTIVEGILKDEIIEGWKRWNLPVWKDFQQKGILT